MLGKLLTDAQRQCAIQLDIGVEVEPVARGVLDDTVEPLEAQVMWER